MKWFFLCLLLTQSLYADVLSKSPTDDAGTCNPDAACSESPAVSFGGTAACIAASREFHWPDGLQVPEAVGMRVAAYRKSWQTVCMGQGNHLGPLWTEAGVIEKAFQSAWPPKKSPGWLWPAKPDAAIQALPAILPGFESSTGEYEYLRASVRSFGENIASGDEEDRVFFPGFSALQPKNLPPWVEQTWDYGGCIRFGAFDWIGTLDKIEALKKRVHQPSYRAVLDPFESSFWDEITTPKKDICACANKGSVVKDLENVRQHVGPSAAHYAAIGAVIENIRSRKITVRSEAEAHCSGG